MPASIPVPMMFARLKRRNSREVCRGVRNSNDQFARIRTLQDFTVDRESDVKCMWLRQFILRDDRRPKKRERIETLPPDLTDSWPFAHPARLHFHDRVS